MHSRLLSQSLTIAQSSTWSKSLEALCYNFRTEEFGPGQLSYSQVLLLAIVSSHTRWRHRLLQFETRKQRRFTGGSGLSCSWCHSVPGLLQPWQH